MKGLLLLLALLPADYAMAASCQAQSAAEYYAAVYARHYRLPPAFVFAVITQESGWHSCIVSNKGAVGLMQLMPGTALRLGVENRCDVRENISGGVRYLAWLNQKFKGDLRLVAASYYVGEHAIEKRGLAYSNPDVVAYVESIRAQMEQEKRIRSAIECAPRSRSK